MSIRQYARQCQRCRSTTVHLLIETPKPNLGAGMQRLHGLYATAFNRGHRRSGHLFQGRFGAVRVKTDSQLLEATRYLALNPVAAGLCDEPAAWPWSSHAAAQSEDRPRWLDSARLLAYFGGFGGGDPGRRYGEFVEVGVR